MRPLHNAPFRPISALRSDFNPQNIHYIRACPVKCLPREMHSLFLRGKAYFSGVVKIITRLDLERN